MACAPDPAVPFNTLADHGIGIPYAPPRFIKVKKFCELTGYTEAAIYHKISHGVWMQNREYRKGPDNVVLVDVEGYERWVLGARAAA